MRLCYAAAAVLCLAPVLDAQSVRGVVTSADMTTGVSGVVILLLNRSDSVVARALSNERGEYRVATGIAGTYRIRTLRIGYRPWISGTIELAAGRELVRSLALAGVQFSLDTVKVVGKNACRGVTDSAVATFAVWEQVRTALTATQLSASERAITATTLNYRRVLDKNLDRVRRQESRLNASLVTQPWLTMPPEELRRQGYVLNAADSTTYFAPGIDVLLSNEFLEDHCFHLTTSSDPRRIGIAFEPTSERRTVADIRGTLWIERKSSELRSLEFRYVNISRQQEQRSGGEMEFARMSSGAWAISRWNIRMPVLAQRRAAVELNAETLVLEVAVEGGELVMAMRGNDTLWSRPPLVLVGTVSDSLTGAPAAHARIQLLGTTLSTETDTTGRFVIRGVLPGEYTAEVHTAALDAIGAVVQTTVTFIDSAATLRLRIPSPQQIGASFCGVLPNERQGIVVGRVTFRGEPTSAENLRVFVSWGAGRSAGRSANGDLASSSTASNGGVLVAVSGLSTNQRRGKTDAMGRFRICGVPTKTALLVQAEVDSSSSEPVGISIDEGLFGRADLLVDLLASRGAMFMGYVLADSTKRPIADAEVSLPELGLSQRTDSAGAFQFHEVAFGSHRLTVRHFGYGSLDTNVPFVNKVVDRNIFLTRVTTLDSVNVIAKVLENRDFEDNRKAGLGHFFTRADLDGKHAQTLGSILTEIPSARVVGGTNHAWLTGGRGIKSMLGSDMTTPTRLESLQGAKTACYANVYVDNTLMFRKGDPLFDINTIPPDQVESIEYYAGAAQTPLKYSSLNNVCGVVVIWLRK